MDARGPLASSPSLTDLNLISLEAGEGFPNSGLNLESMLGGLQAGEVWLVEVKTLTLDMGS
jgi:hypothetical protein